MEPVDITYGRAFKVWWSYSWRAMVLTVMAVVPLQLLFFGLAFAYRPTPDHKVDPAEFAKYMPLFMLGWLVITALMLALQAYGMKWMLRDAKWSDFRIAVLPKDV
jgi:heme/copper-type cytochrome/quinol oxidase subunit 2